MLTTILFFAAAVLFIILIVFFNAVEKDKKGVAILIALGFSAITLSLAGTMSAIYVKPFTGAGEIVNLSEVEAHRSGSVKLSGYTPKCYSVLIAPISHKDDDPLRNLCIPYSQWKELKVSETVSFGHDKDRHPYWGNYIVGNNEPARSLLAADVIL